MVDKKNIILAFGNKEFNNSLNEIQEYLSFNLITLDNYKDYNSSESYQGFIIHEDAFKDKNFLCLENSSKRNVVVLFGKPVIFEIIGIQLTLIQYKQPWDAHFDLKKAQYLLEPYIYSRARPAKGQLTMQ